MESNNQYSKPKVTIDLDEYNELLKIKNSAEEEVTKAVEFIKEELEKESIIS